MKIAFFDSGLGGLTVSRRVLERLPNYDYLYLGDNRRAPYGSRSQEEIYAFTRQGVSWLFTQGAKICILSCNTASSMALRRLQREWLPRAFPDRKLLGVIIPIAEAVAGQSRGLIGLIGTPATVASQAYNKELRKLRGDIKIIQVAAPKLVPLIEENASQEKIRSALKEYCFPFQQTRLDTLILGSTHYSLISPLFKELLGEHVRIPDTSKIIAESLCQYLLRHQEIETQLTRERKKMFYTTGDPVLFGKASERFLGKKLKAMPCVIKEF